MLLRTLGTLLSPEYQVNYVLLGVGFRTARGLRRRLTLNRVDAYSDPAGSPKPKSMPRKPRPHPIT